MKITTSLLIGFATMVACQPPKDNSRAVNTYTIEQFYQNIRIGGGAFSPDESKLLVHSDESGIFNLYEIDLADGSRKPLTHSTVESFFAVDYVPGTGEVLYSSDKGGNEISHLYLLAGDGSSRDLTPGEQEKVNFLQWAADDKAFFYLSNKRDDRFFDLYKMPVDTWEPILVFENKEGLQVDAISDDEKTIALGRPITTSQAELYLLDLASGNRQSISVGEPGAYQTSGFSRDSRTFFFTTDAGREFSYLVKFDIGTGLHETLFESDWDVMYSAISRKEKYRVVAINEDGRNRIVLQDNATGTAVDFPDIPDGDIVAVEISDSEQKARLTVGTSRAPNNLYLYDFATKELKKLTETLNPEIDPNDLVSAEVIRYQSFDGLEIPAIYYKPHNASVEHPAPALVWVHGGPGGQSRTGYFALIQYLVNQGYAVLAVNNRGSSGYGKTFYKMDDRNHGDKDLKDCIAGKGWLAQQPYIDGERIGIIGGSYGGYMTMAAMTFAPDEFRVGVNIFGVTNWLRTLKSIPPYWESFRQALYQEMGDPYGEDSTRLYNISPLFHADQVKHPVMVLQGANDPRVLQVESDEIVEAVRKNNVPVEYVIFPDEGHGFVKKENEIRGYRQIGEFLDKYLKAAVKG